MLRSSPRPRSKSSTRPDPEYDALKRRIHERARGACEARLKNCWGQANDLHHVWVKRKGGPLVCPDDWAMAVCRSCHGEIHQKESTYRGRFIAYSEEEMLAIVGGDEPDF